MKKNLLFILCLTGSKPLTSLSSQAKHYKPLSRFIKTTKILWEMIMLVLEDIITYPYLYHNWLLHEVIVFL